MSELYEAIGKLRDFLAVEAGAATDLAACAVLDLLALQGMNPQYSWGTMSLVIYDNSRCSRKDEMFYGDGELSQAVKAMVRSEKFKKWQEEQL